MEIGYLTLHSPSRPFRCLSAVFPVMTPGLSLASLLVPGKLFLSRLVLEAGNWSLR